MNGNEEGVGKELGVWMGKGMGEGMEVRVRKGMSVGGAKDGVWKGLCDGEGSGGDGCLEEDRVEKGMRTGIWKGTGMENLMRMGMEKQTDIWEVMRMEKGMRMEMHKENGDSEVNVEGGEGARDIGWVLIPPCPPPRCGRASSTGGCGVPRGASPRSRPARRSTTPPRASPRLAPTTHPGCPVGPPTLPGTERGGTPAPRKARGGVREPRAACSAHRPWPYPAPGGVGGTELPHTHHHPHPPPNFRGTRPPFPRRDGGEEEAGDPSLGRGVPCPLPPHTLCHTRWPGAGRCVCVPHIFFFFLSIFRSFTEKKKRKN